MVIENTMKCEHCLQIFRVGDWPFCPHGVGHSNVNGDEIPGGQWQENGFRTPQKFYSKKERIRALAAVGLEERICNAGVHDKIVARMVTMDPYTLWAAGELAKRNGGSKGKEPEPEPGLNITWTNRELPR